eukprot:844299-Amorphochlora_amoeboformis.AAC.1
MPLIHSVVARTNRPIAATRRSVGGKIEGIVRCGGSIPGVPPRCKPGHDGSGWIGVVGRRVVKGGDFLEGPVRIRYMDIYLHII